MLGSVLGWAFPCYLPQSITGKGLTYTYDAASQKLRKQSGTTITEYISGIQYSGNTTGTTIEFVQTEEGRAFNSGGNYTYEYSLGDHLGNTRLSFNQNGTATQQDDYYPFGLEISKGVVSSPKNEYLYNKKELQEELTQYDYGARFYDPVIARWTTVDPLAEISRRFSPYVYVENNPIKMVDPDGMLATYNWDSGTYQDGDKDVSWNEVQQQYGIGQTGNQNGQPKKQPSTKPEERYMGPGPLEAHMTSKERAEYYKESAKNAAWIMGGALSWLKVGDLIPWMGRILGLTGDAAAVELNFEEFANEIIQINKTTEGDGILLSGTPESAINSALYYEKANRTGSSHLFPR